MKFKNLFLLLLLTITAISCKDEAKKQDGSVPTQEENVAPDNTFKLALTLVAKKDDDFCLLYTEDGSLNFKDGVWQHVKGLESEQAIQFVLPNDKFPTELRLDLGKNPNQDDLIVKSLKFEYAGKVREIKGAEIGTFFRADAAKCTYDITTGVIRGLVKDGVKQSPSLYPHENVLSIELPKLAK